jgi:hypothetical protein
MLLLGCQKFQTRSAILRRVFFLIKQYKHARRIKMDRNTIELYETCPVADKGSCMIVDEIEDNNVSLFFPMKADDRAIEIGKNILLKSLFGQEN